MAGRRPRSTPTTTCSERRVHEHQPCQQHLGHSARTWVKAGYPLCLIGDSGTGKSHLLIGLGTAAAEAGHRVRYTLASKLVNELVEAADDKQLSKTIARYGRVDLLCLDLCRHRDYAELRAARLDAQDQVSA
jgi:DNA replication protein DnaC